MPARRCLMAQIEMVHRFVEQGDPGLLASRRAISTRRNSPALTGSPASARRIRAVRVHPCSCMQSPDPALLLRRVREMGCRPLSTVSSTLAPKPALLCCSSMPICRREPAAPTRDILTGQQDAPGVPLRRPAGGESVWLLSGAVASEQGPDWPGSMSRSRPSHRVP